MPIGQQFRGNESLAQGKKPKGGQPYVHRCVHGKKPELHIRRRRLCNFQDFPREFDASVGQNRAGVWSRPFKNARCFRYQTNGGFIDDDKPYRAAYFWIKTLDFGDVVQSDDVHIFELELHHPKKARGKDDAITDENQNQFSRSN